MNTKHTRASGNIIKNWSTRLALLAVGASTLGAGQARAAGLFGLSDQEEIKAGQQVARQAQQEYGRALPASDPMARRVNAIGRRFANIAERRNIPYTYTVLQNDKVLNAFAAPGGPIFVTTKLVRTTANDAELAYVLGHETAHIERRHIAKSVEKQQKVGLAAGVLGAILGNKGGNVLGAAVNVTYNLWQRGYSRDHERDSDVVGVRMMSRLGYDPRAAASMLRKLDDGGRGGGLDKYLATHPAPASRIQAVNAQIQKENLLDVARRSGGPRLSDNGSYSGGSYAANGDAYPGDTGYSNTSNEYPDYNSDSTPSGSGTQVADLGGPLRIVEREDSSVILASATGVARWAGATARANGTALVLSRGGRTIEVRRNSNVAFLNGRRRTLSAVPQIFDGQLYAPLGDLVEGVGGRARFDEQLNAIRLELDGRESIISLRR